MNCHKGEIGRTTLGGKIMNTVFYISSLGCLLKHSNEYLKQLAYELEFSGEAQAGDPKLEVIIVEKLIQSECRQKRISRIEWWGTPVLTQKRVCILSQLLISSENSDDLFHLSEPLF